jgi:hypothetical protein
MAALLEEKICICTKFMTAKDNAKSQDSPQDRRTEYYKSDVERTKIIYCSSPFGDPASDNNSLLRPIYAPGVDGSSVS